MAINQNHLFEEMNGIKCAVVEKNVFKERVEFIQQLLEFNQYIVVVVPSPPPKIPAPTSESVQAVPETFTIGVTDVMFNSINAVFGRLLKAPGGGVVTLAYWQQKDIAPHDEVPYFDK